MPNRILKESICSSEDIDKLKPFEEIFFYRLIVKCDDFGRYDARPKVLKSALFPIKDGVTAKNVEDALHTLASVGLVKLYEVDGRPFLFLPTWLSHQQKRANKSKFPEPRVSDITCNQSQSDSLVFENDIRNSIFDIRNSSNGNDAREDAPTQDKPDDLDVFSDALRDTVSDWFAYKAEKRQPYKPTGRKSLITEILNNVQTHGESAVIEVIRQSMGSNYQGIVWDRIGKEIGCKPGNSRLAISPPGKEELRALERAKGWLDEKERAEKTS